MSDTKPDALDVVSVVLVVLAIFIVACLPGPSPTPEPTVEPTVEPTLTPTPVPTATPYTAPRKLLLHYYSDDNFRYGRDEQAVSIRNSARVDRFGAIKDSSDPKETDEVLVARMAAVLDRVPRGTPIIIGLDYRWASSGSDGGLRVVGLIFQMFKSRDRWGDVIAIEICDEPEGGASEVEADCADIKAAVAGLGLATKPLAITFTESSLVGKASAARGLRGLRDSDEGIVATTSDYVAGDGLMGDRIPSGMVKRPRPASLPRRGVAVDAGQPGFMAPDLDIVTFELYAPLQTAWATDEVVAGWPLVSASRQISAVRAMRPNMKFACVIMGYGRNYDGLDRLGWRNMRTLALLNRQSFVAILDRQEVLWAAIFSCGRETCTCDPKNPQVGTTLRPVHSAARRMIDDPTTQWPPLPIDPQLKFPERLAPNTLHLKARGGDTAGLNEARRWGVIVINNVEVYGQCRGTSTTCKADDSMQFYGRKTLRWSIKTTTPQGQEVATATLNDGTYNASLGWSQAVSIGDTPTGSKIVVGASLTVGSRTVSWRGEWTVHPAGYVPFGRCDVDGKQRVPIWVSDVTGKARCAAHGGAWPAGE